MNAAQVFRDVFLQISLGESLRPVPINGIPVELLIFFMLFSESVTTQRTFSSHSCSEENWGFDHLIMT